MRLRLVLIASICVLLTNIAHADTRQLIYINDSFETSPAEFKTASDLRFHSGGLDAGFKFDCPSNTGGFCAHPAGAFLSMDSVAWDSGAQSIRYRNSSTAGGAGVNVTPLTIKSDSENIDFNAGETFIVIMDVALAAGAGQRSMIYGFMGKSSLSGDSDPTYVMGADNPAVNDIGFGVSLNGASIDLIRFNSGGKVTLDNVSSVLIDNTAPLHENVDRMKYTIIVISDSSAGTDWDVTLEISYTDTTAIDTLNGTITTANLFHYYVGASTFYQADNAVNQLESVQFYEEEFFIQTDTTPPTVEITTLTEGDTFPIGTPVNVAGTTATGVTTISLTTIDVENGILHTDNSSTSTIVDTTHLYTTAGDFVIQMFAVDDNGETSNIDTLTITIVDTGILAVPAGILGSIRSGVSPIRRLRRGL